jgi:hypothetical protein
VDTPDTCKTGASALQTAVQTQYTHDVQVFLLVYNASFARDLGQRLTSRRKRDAEPRVERRPLPSRPLVTAERGTAGRPNLQGVVDSLRLRKRRGRAHMRKNLWVLLQGIHTPSSSTSFAMYTVSLRYVVS